MKRQKRPRSDRAYKGGFQAGIKGRSKDNCPYGDSSQSHDQWLGGWREGRMHFKNGYLGETNEMSH